MKYNRSVLSILIVVLFMLAACSRLPGSEESSTAGTPTVTRLFQPVSTASTENTETTLPETVAPAASPTAGPSPVIITMEDQTLSEEGQLTIGRLVTQQPGWVVIYNDDSGEAGEPLGYVQVTPGDNEAIVVSIDPFEASPTLYAMFHLDEGQSGTFEFPGPDRPAQSGNEMVVTSFNVDIQIYFPDISVGDQAVAEDGLVTVQATAAEPSWVVISADEEGSPAQMLAYAPLKVGVNETVTLAINWRTAPPKLHAELYVDGGQADTFEDQDLDSPILLDGEPVATSFEVMYPPDIDLLDQPVVNGAIIVERVISYEPNWLVVYNQNEDESLGNIIGWSPLEVGINTQVAVTITEGAATPVLYAMLHADLEELGEFEFPRTDPVVIYEDGMHPFAFRTDSGNYLITRDQPLSSSNTVIVPLVVADEDSWVVVRADEEGELGEILGRRWVPAGVTREIEVTLNGDLVTPTLQAVLHLDAGTARVFDFPEGLDVPFQRNRSIIQAPFRLTGIDEP